jgi:hypothetical protein
MSEYTSTGQPAVQYLENRYRLESLDHVEGFSTLVSPAPPQVSSSPYACRMSGAR